MIVWVIHVRHDLLFGYQREVNVARVSNKFMDRQLDCCGLKPTMLSRAHSLSLHREHSRDAALWILIHNFNVVNNLSRIIININQALLCCMQLQVMLNTNISSWLIDCKSAVFHLKYHVTYETAPIAKTGGAVIWRIMSSFALNTPKIIVFIISFRFITAVCFYYV